MPYLFQPDAVFLQRFLRLGGYYKADINGLFGPKTQTALQEFQADSQIAQNEFGTLDARTETNIATLTIPTQRLAQKFMRAVGTAGLSAGLQAFIICGTRTYAEQSSIFAQGTTAPGSIVTYARAGQSNHNFGIAWDMGIFDASGLYIDDQIGVAPAKRTSAQVDAEYQKLGVFGKGMGLFWGGDWQNADYPHFQTQDNDMLATLRSNFEQGTAPA
jgi:peptidoglycan L-alanyl-D-glutamate endopeptidase CwlK